MAAVTIFSDFGAQENSLSLFPLFPHLFVMKWWDQMPWSLFFECWVSSQFFSLFSFTFNKRLFSSSSFSALRVVSSAYLRLLIFLPAILIPACASSTPAFWMMYSSYKLNKQGDNIQPWGTPFPIWNQSIVPCQQKLTRGQTRNPGKAYWDSCCNQSRVKQTTFSLACSLPMGWRGWACSLYGVRVRVFPDVDTAFTPNPILLLWTLHKWVFQSVCIFCSEFAPTVHAQLS